MAFDIHHAHRLRGGCPLVGFFNTRRAVEAWVAQKGLEGDIVSVAAVATGRRPAGAPGLLTFQAAKYCRRM